jgi:HAD superfamily hydrolase (TIGR01509 family)
MIDLKGIRNIILDLGGVILELDVDRSIRALKDLGFPGLERLDIIFSKYPFFLAFETGKITADQFIDAVIEQLKDHTPREKIIDAWNAMILGFRPDTIDLLKKLREKYRIFLLSNTNAIHEIHYNQQLYAEHGIHNLKDIFEKVYYSHDLKMRKPDHEIFRHVLADSRLDAGETLYVDDTEVHVNAARDLGVLAFHLQSPQRLTEVLCW